MHHRRPAPFEAMEGFDGFGPCSATCMFRCALFGHFRGRMKQGNANPKEMFLSLAEVFREMVGKMSWRLPTLEECQSANELGTTVSPMDLGGAVGGQAVQRKRKAPREASA